MSEFENYIAPDEGAGGREQSEEAKERFAEQMREAAKKLAASKKDEKKAKRRDKHLAKLLEHFIRHMHGTDEERLLNTLVLCLKNQMPTEMLVALLTIMYPTLKEVLFSSEENAVMQVYAEEKLRVMSIPYDPGQVSYGPSEFNEHELPEEVKVGINSWIQNLLAAVRIHPDWLLARVLRGGEPDAALVQLTTILLEKFLQVHKVTGEFERIRQFALFILSGVLTKAGQEVEKSDGKL
ncbi:hypothetical protein COW46_05065 [Candidatus Gracilibacteria bacterium CG17_big_fil_post_rev_8_21_14_2_50_48_13]|nr:MAG: hypothetical protein COW46_05065 [Candidatus Gracilibacteria bacterium CG17_big_fil_post_rev_8_21_14_2_50_48_13]